ncbi:MAG: MFS transporter [Lyngbya sp.]|nr:MFS transporter [Lyngbya sp.]
MRSLNSEKKSALNPPNSHLKKEAKNGYIDRYSQPEKTLNPKNNDNGYYSKNTPENPPDYPKNATSNMLLEEEEERGFLPVLKNQNFLVLWSGQVFSQLADKVYLVLMIALISTRFQQPDQTISGWVSAVMIAFTIPAVLFGAGAGVYVDRWPKKIVLVLTNLLRGGFVLAVPLVLWFSEGMNLGRLPLGFCLLLTITFLVSTLTQFFAPAEQTVIPLIVKRNHLLSANSLYTTTMMASVIIGFAVGEPLLAIADKFFENMGWGLDIGKELIVGGAYAIAGLLLLGITVKEKRNFQAESPHILDDLRDGIQYLNDHHKVRNALIQLIILFSIFAALAVLAVRLAEIIPSLKSSQFGFLLAAAGVGMGIGAALLGQLGHRLSHIQLALVGSIGLASCLMGLALFGQQLVSAFILIVLLGLCAAVVGIPMQTTIQAETPEQMRGKVFGLQNNAVNIALSLPLALAGVAETYLGLSAVFVALAAMASLGGVLTWYITKREFKQ